AFLCLGLGIGAPTAIFSVIYAVLLRQLPYANADRLVRVFTEFPNFPNGGLRHFWVSPPEFLDLKRDATGFQAVEGWVTQGVNLAGASEPVRSTVGYVSGRLLSPQDDAATAPLTAVISYGLWQRAFGGASVLGRDIRLNGNACTVVGVMPRSFAFPLGELDPPELWVPVQIDPARRGGRGSHYLSLLALLKPGTGIAQADAEMTRYAK